MIKIDINLSELNCCALITLFLIILLFNFFDVYYFLRLIIQVGYSLIFEKPIGLHDTCTVYGICTTNDLDFVLKHMNNARFLRELDFARILFYVKTGAAKIIKKTGGDILQSACSIRYRRTIPFLTSYKITTKLIYWDENALYLEHQFISLKDGFIRAAVFSQQKVLKMNVEDLVKKVLNEEDPKRLTAPEELLPWIESMKMSSDKLRKKD